MSRPRVVIEVAARDENLARDLAAGGIFVPTCELAVMDMCDLVVTTAAGDLSFEARVVFSAPTGGCGLELVGFGPALRDQLSQLLADAAARTASLQFSADDAAAADEEGPGPSSEEPAREPLAKNVYERLRGLTLPEQLKKAHSPDPAERMALERMYGKSVWEALLRNPRLTAPEVARLARMGSLPKPLLEIIVNNGSWLQVAEVRRALLSNPRLGTDQTLRVLRLLPKHELKLASTMTAYPYAVRDAAKRLLKDA